MLAKVIIGIDGGEGGRDALALARQLVPDARCLLAGVYSYPSPESRLGVPGFQPALEERVLDDLAEWKAESGLTHAETIAVAATAPAAGLHALAEREEADLLIIGSSHRGRIGRILLGDVAREALHGSPCPVAVAPRDYRHDYKGVAAVAFDGSAEARAALELATDVAVAGGLRLRLVTAVQIASGAAGEVYSATTLLEELRLTAQAMLDEEIERLPVKAVGEVLVGGTSGLVEALGDADVLVCGSRGWGPVRRVVLGSFADRLVHQAHVPVVVVPRSSVAAGPEAGDHDPAIDTMTPGA